MLCYTLYRIGAQKMKNKSLVILQRVASSLMDADGKWLKSPVGIVASARTNKEGIKRLKNIIEIILNSPSVSKYTKRFIATPNSSIKQVSNIITLEEKEVRENVLDNTRIYGYTYIVKQVSNDCKLIFDAFGYENIINCINNNIVSYVEVDARIVEFIAKYGSSCNERDNLILRLDKSTVEKNKYCGSQEFFNMLERLRPYLVTEKQKAEDEINRDIEFIGYFNYLLCSAPFTDNADVRRDRDRLLRFLRGDDVSISSLNNNSSGI